jgi:hypothetical protein
MESMLYDADSGQQPTPPVIPQFETDFDPFGILATIQPSGPTQTSQNAFFRQSRHQSTHLLHLSSAANRLERERSQRAGSVCRKLWQ